MSPEVYLGAVLTMQVTAYGLGCDAPGKLTWSGTVPREQWTVAADLKVLPVGTRLHIGGLAPRYRVEDRGSAVKGMRLDVFMLSCDLAKAWGVQERDVVVMDLPDVRSKPSSVEGHARYDGLKGIAGSAGGNQRHREVSSATAEDRPYVEDARLGGKGAGIKPGLGFDRASATPAPDGEMYPGRRESSPGLSEGRYATDKDPESARVLSERTAEADRRDVSATLPSEESKRSWWVFSGVVLALLFAQALPRSVRFFEAL